MRNLLEGYIKYIANTLFLTSVSALGVKILWNSILPNISQLTDITYIQAFGLVILTSLLIKPTVYVDID